MSPHLNPDFATHVSTNVAQTLFVIITEHHRIAATEEFQNTAIHLAWKSLVHLGVILVLRLLSTDTIGHCFKFAILTAKKRYVLLWVDTGYMTYV
jgi:hypothetical protein